MRRLLLLVSLLFFVGCGEKAITMEKCHQARKKHYDAMVQYYDNNGISGYIDMIEEPKTVVCLETTDLKEVYRLTIIPSFENQIIITVFVRGDVAQLNLQVFEPPGCCFVKLIQNDTFKLSEEQLNELRHVVANSPFCEYGISRRPGRDGSDWVVQIKQQGKYYCGLEWSPRYGSDIYNIGKCLLELSGYE